MAEAVLSADPRFVGRERQPGLDLLRALAIVLVVFYHSGIYGFALLHRWHRFGWIGVDLFFVLSGYLIAGQLLTPLAQGRQLDLRRFFGRRALRILPAYLVILAIYFLLPNWREFPTIPPLWKFLAFVQNIGLRGGTAFSHAWSLCVEGQFYLVLPFVLIVVARHRDVGLTLAAIVIGMGLVLRGLLGYANPGAFQRLVYYPTWTRLDPLVCGVSLAAIECFYRTWWLWLQNAVRWLWIIGLAAIIYGLSLGESNLTIATCVWQFPLIAFGMSIMLVCAVSPRLPLRRHPLPGAAFVASIAYSVYLSHKLIIHAVTQLCARWQIPLASSAGVSLNICAIFLAGSLLFFTVERPFLQLRRRRLPPKASALP